MKEIILEMKNITKSFPGVRALDNISINFRRGSVHTLIGENGAGKSTLMKILMGLYHTDCGEIFLEGMKIVNKGIKELLDLGISMIHQELTYIPNMTISENIFLGREVTYKIGSFVKEKEIFKHTKDLLDLVGADLNPNTKMKDLSVAEKQMVEIAKAVSYNSKVIIMDEPTSAISDTEVEHLFNIISGLKKRGVAIIYISHKFDEIFKISDEATVLRDGTWVGTYMIEEVSSDQLISLMVGRDICDVFPKRDNQCGEVILSVRGLTKRGVFENISFDVKKGEVFGIGGLMGSKRTEVISCIYGLDKYDEGEIFVKGKKVCIRNPKDAIRLGIGLVSEDRKKVGLVLNQSVKNNLTLSNLSVCSNGVFIAERKEEEIVDKMIKKMSVKTPGRNQKVVYLSGGNQQKVVIGKTLLNQSDILILDEPTRGIDVGAKSEIYKLVNQLTQEGKAVIMISSEMPELIGMSDRIIVLREGKLTGALNKDEISQEKIMKCALGH